MTIAISARSLSSMRSAFPWAALGITLTILVASLLLHDTLFHGGAGQVVAAGAETAAGAVERAPAPSSSGGMPSSVSLSPAKLEKSRIATQKVAVLTLPAELGVPGRIEPNLNRQLQVRPRASGVIRSVEVELGRKVAEGDVLAVIDSADVGTARLDLRARQRELATARIEADWKKQVATNVASIIPELRKKVEAADLAKTYADRPLGGFRATLLQAYSEFDIALHEEQKTSGLYEKQILGEHPAFVAKHSREGVQAKFEAALEQARFDSNLQSLIAEQTVKKAEYAVIDAAEHLRLLGVPQDIAALLERAGDVAASGSREGTEDVTSYPILAPFEGTIIAKTDTAVASQKVEISDVLFTVADLSTVWVRADISESDFSLLPAMREGNIRLTATAYPTKSFQAKLLSSGATVDPTTRTIPIRAQASNTDDLLKLGMFVRITLDTAVDQTVVTVPAGAVVEIEGVSGVFAPDGSEPSTFHFKPVKLGREAGDKRVVEGGLHVGDVVVAEGAFVLKSELILQNQVEED